MAIDMLVTYDAEVDAAYIAFVEIPAGGVAFTVSDVQPPECPGEINLDFDSSGALLGVEVLWASRALPPEVIERAEKI